MKNCENCTEWEFFECYGYGCFCMKTMIPLDAEKCEFYSFDRIKDTRTIIEADKENNNE